MLFAGHKRFQHAFLSVHYFSPLLLERVRSDWLEIIVLCLDLCSASCHVEITHMLADQQRSLDQLSCAIDLVLNFLSFLFERGQDTIKMTDMLLTLILAKLKIKG